MRRLLSIRPSPLRQGEYRRDEKEEWRGRVHHLEHQISAIVEERVFASEERLLRALDMVMEAVSKQQPE